MLSLVLPTYNESASVPPLIDILDAVLRNVPHEIIIVDDDSPDGTWRIAESLKIQHPSVRVLRRIGRRGLSSAVVEGFDMAIGDTLAVMDADGQHDTELLVRLVDALKKGSDLAIGSRYIEGGSVGDWVRDRRIISTLGSILARRVSRVPVSDPLGGFFAFKKTLYKKVRPDLKPTGFKILLEILANVSPSIRVAEIPLVFRMRLQGESKLSLSVHAAFLLQVFRLSVRRIVSGACNLCTVLFWLIIVFGTLILLPRAWALRSLADADVRQHAADAIHDLADNEGWLLSDIQLLSVDKKSLTLRHKQHARVTSASTTCTIIFTPFSSSCEP
jgi:dolichol-phosphate mannosyltransferase